MKRVLLTGSAGFVGSHIVEHILKNTDWEIIGIDSFKHRGDSMRVCFDPKRYKIFTHDLAAPISDRMIAAIGHIDYILNIASESHVDRSLTDPVPFVQNNVNLMLTMLEYARIVRPEKFIQMSTDEVYGPAPEGINHKEWSIIIPSNPYSASKACQEAIAISYWRAYDVPVILTNTMNIIGERQDPEKFLPMLISRINKGEEVVIHGTPDNIGTRFYLHARNQADALLYLLLNKDVTRYVDSPDRICLPDRFHIVGEIELDNLTLARMVADIMGKELKYKLIDFHSARPGHDRRYALDGGKIASIGWKAPVSFHDSLKKTIEWTLKNPEWMV